MGRKHSCRNCVFYVKSGRYCLRLGRRVDDPSNPPCMLSPRELEALKQVAEEGGPISSRLAEDTVKAFEEVAIWGRVQHVHVETSAISLLLALTALVALTVFNASTSAVLFLALSLLFTLAKLHKAGAAIAALKEAVLVLREGNAKLKEELRRTTGVYG